MNKYIAKVDDIEIKFTSKRTVTHAVLVGGKCLSKHGTDCTDVCLMSAVGRGDLVEAAAKKAAKLYENVYVVEVAIVD